MEKTNVWDIVNKEVEHIIKCIENGEVKTRKEYNEYLEGLYNWKISDAVESIISVYLSVTNINFPWGYEILDKV